ncbi:MAG: hypothetical protein ACREJV_09775 [Candidatus Rokuibacteriota bacterium]
MKRVLGVLIALVVAVAGVSVTLAQTSTPPPARTTSDKKTTGAKKDETMTAKTAVGTAKSVSADSLVVAGKTKDKETEWTFAVVSATTVRKAGRKVTASELKPGDLVRVRYVEHDGKSVAQNIAVTTPAK